MRKKVCHKKNDHIIDHKNNNSDALYKLPSQNGETIAETLAALLIAALALVMLAGAITTSSSLVSRSREKIGDYYSANEIMVEMPASVSGSDVNVTGPRNGELKFSTTDTIINGSRTNPPTLNIAEEDVFYYQNRVFSNSDPITTYKLGSISNGG